MTETEQQPQDGRAERFLSVEDTAHRLSESLAELAKESDRYEAASTRLKEVAAVSLDLLSAVQEVGVQARQALVVVASVGGPAILEQVETVDRSLTETGAKLDTIQSDLSTRADEVSQGLAETRDKIDNLATKTAHDLNAQRALFSERTTNLEKQLAGKLQTLLYVTAASVVLLIAVLVVGLMR